VGSGGGEISVEQKKMRGRKKEKRLGPLKVFYSGGMATRGYQEKGGRSLRKKEKRVLCRREERD